MVKVLLTPRKNHNEKKPINHDGQAHFPGNTVGWLKKTRLLPNPPWAFNWSKSLKKRGSKRLKFLTWKCQGEQQRLGANCNLKWQRNLWRKTMTKSKLKHIDRKLGMFELWIWCRFIIGRFLGKKLSCPLLSSSFCTWSSSKGRRNVKSGSQDGDACSGLAAFGPRVTTVVPCSYSTLHGTNISHLMTFLSRWFSFSPRWDMDLFRGGYIKNTNVLLGHHSQHASVWTAALVPCWNLTQLTKKPGSLVSMDQRSLKSFLSKETCSASISWYEYVWLLWHELGTTCLLFPLWKHRQRGNTSNKQTNKLHSLESAKNLVAKTNSKLRQKSKVKVVKWYLQRIYSWQLHFCNWDGL